MRRWEDLWVRVEPTLLPVKRLTSLDKSRRRARRGSIAKIGPLPAHALTARRVFAPAPVAREPHLIPLCPTVLPSSLSSSSCSAAP